MKLYELTEEYERLSNHLAEQSEIDADLTPYIEGYLEQLGGLLDNKYRNIASLIKNWKAELEAVKKEKQRFDARRKSLENRINSLLRYTGECLGEGNTWRDPDGIHSLVWQKNPPAVSVENEEDVPEIYLERSVRVDKRAILDRLKNGEEIPGCRLVLDTVSLRLR